MEECILIAVPGRTDPIRGEHDGPILHIIRHYHPEKVILILTEEIGMMEEQYHHNETAIHLMDPNCEVVCKYTGIKNAHSYDNFSIPFLSICDQVCEKNPGKKILVDITSGTPQMETALCMIAISDSERYIPVQVASPERGASKSTHFNPETDLVEDWFETDIDNDGDENRCNIPNVTNFKRPIIQFQILSLIRNYDYAGAYQLYELNKDGFSEKTGKLLDHAKNRLNLEDAKAVKVARDLKMYDVLYPVKRDDILKLVDYFNSMQIKQMRGELNDFAMRLEVMTEFLGIYILEKCMKVKIDDITYKRSRNVICTNEEKCKGKMPGIDIYLDEQFSDRLSGHYDWGKPLNALSIIHFVKFMSQQEAYKKYASAANEMLKWVELSGQVRNPAAHTIIAINEDSIRAGYEGKDSAALCRAMRTVMIQVFENEMKKTALDIYDQINTMIQDSLMKTE